MKVIEFYGGPGVGKSSCAMAVTLALKLGHEDGQWANPLSVEYVPEFGQEQVRSARMVAGNPRRALENQLLMAGTQLHYLERLACDGVEIAVVDSPLWLCAVYAQALDRYPDDAWRAVLRAQYKQPIPTPRGPERVEVLPVWLSRVDRHHSMQGRVQEQDEAAAVHSKVYDLAVAEWGPGGLFQVPARAKDAAALVVVEARRRGWVPEPTTTSI